MTGSTTAPTHPTYIHTHTQKHTYSATPCLLSTCTHTLTHTRTHSLHLLQKITAAKLEDSADRLHVVTLSPSLFVLRAPESWKPTQQLGCDSRSSNPPTVPWLRPSSYSTLRRVRSLNSISVCCSTMTTLVSFLGVDLFPTPGTDEIGALAQT